jgi:hypothetical protein
MIIKEKTNIPSLKNVETGISQERKPKVYIIGSK